MPPFENQNLSKSAIDSIVEALWSRMIGQGCDPIELGLRARLALEHCLIGGRAPPFGLDKLGAEETAAYVGVQVETLRDKTKRRTFGIPSPYHFGRKLFWRRSELDPWIERHRTVDAEFE